MKRFCVLVCLLLARPGPAETAPVTGRVCFGRQGQVAVLRVGEHEPVVLGSGRWPRWSPDGRHLVAYDRQALVWIDLERGVRSNLVSGVTYPGSPAFFDVHPNGTEVWWIDAKKGIRSVNVRSGTVNDVMPMRRRLTGEFSVSAEGRRATARGGRDAKDRDTNRLFALTLPQGDAREFRYPACSPGLSPDGTLLMHNGGKNDQSHHKLTVRRWEGPVLCEVDAGSVHAKAEWDNHHWSNHPDWIAGQIHSPPSRGEDVVLIHWPSNRAYQISHLGKVEHPDLFVEASGSPTESGRAASPTPRPTANEGLRVRARLVQKSRLPHDLDYRQALIAYHYHVEALLAGTSAETDIIVLHQAVRDRRRLPRILDRAEGTVVEMQLLPLTAKPDWGRLFRADQLDLLTAPVYVDPTPY